MKIQLQKTLRIFALIMIGALISAQHLWAKPAAPEKFYGESYGKNTVGFMWQYNDANCKFNLYHAKGKTDDLKKFKKAEYSEDQLFNDSTGYYLYYEEREEGIQSYYITAYNEEGESENSNIITIEPAKEQDMIWFTGYPEIASIKKGEKFEYEFQAESNVEDANIRFSLREDSDKGATIDEVNGDFEFSSDQSGRYKFIIRAELKDNPKVFTELYFEIKVLSCENGATISGLVTDEENNPIEMGQVFLMASGDDWEKIYPQAYADVVKGEYKFENVDEGDYYLYFTAYGNRKDSMTFYLSEYYNNAQDLKDAEVIKIECGKDYSYSAQLAEQDMNQYKIEITSEPPKSAKIGDEVKYQVTYKTELENPDPEFSMYSNDENAKIDPNTGLMTWKPEKNGVYYFNIYVTLKGKFTEPAFQEFNISVRECENPATVYGLVTDTENNPIKDGYVSLYPIESNDKEFYGYSYSANIIDGQYKIENVDKGKYYLYFQGGYNEREEKHPIYMGQWYDNASDPKNAKIIELNCGDEFKADAKLKEHPSNKYKIEITSKANESIKLGETWEYQIEVKTNIQNPEFVYDLYSSVEGPVVDQETGKISWTPEENGIYQMSLMVYTKEFGPEFATYQEITLKVRECEEAAKLNITVKNSEGELIPNSLVYVLSAKNNSDKYDFKVAWYGIFENGEGVIEDLDKGDYYVYIQSFNDDSTYTTSNYYPWWYDAKYDFEKADVLSINCGETKTINAVLEIIPEPTYYKVSGKVVDKETQEPINEAIVVFMGTDKKMNITNYFETFVDSEGKYSIELPDNCTYLAYASVFGMKDGQKWQDFYVPQFYDGVTDPNEAKVIELNSNIDNINFQLSKPKTYENSLIGVLKGEDDELISKGYIVAYLVECQNKEEEYMLYSGIACSTNDEGKFLIENLIPGKYVIFGSPDNRKSYAPGYYKENELAVLDWEQATQLTINEEGEFGSVNVVLPFKNKGMTGNGKIHGSVSRGKKMKLNNDLSSSDPVNGANIYLLDANGNVVSVVNTLEDGSFKMDNLALGQYLLVADKVGLTSVAQSINLTDTKNESLELIELDEKASDVDDNSTIVSTAYPNPAKNFITVEFEAKTGITEVSVINSNGDEVRNIKLNSFDGLNKINIEAENLSSGSYFIRINNNGNTEILPIIVNK